MVSENELKKLVEQVLLEMTSKDKKVTAKDSNTIKTEVEDGFIEDITTVDIKKQLLVPNPADAKGYLKMKESTPARLGIWRAGPRYKTETALKIGRAHV